jgi:hypothetical protein
LRRILFCRGVRGAMSGICVPNQVPDPNSQHPAADTPQPAAMLPPEQVVERLRDLRSFLLCPEGCGTIAPFGAGRPHRFAAWSRGSRESLLRSRKPVAPWFELLNGSRVIDDLSIGTVVRRYGP